MKETMRRPGIQAVSLYSICIEDNENDIHEIVLPGRSEPHAMQAAELIFASVGPKAFRPFDFISEQEPLGAHYERTADSFLDHLFAAYSAVYQTGPNRALMAEFYDILEYQISYACVIARSPNPAILRTFERQRAARRLPQQIREFSDIPKVQPANPFQPRTLLATKHIAAARQLSAIIKQDLRESSELARKVRQEMIATRQGISRTFQKAMSAERSCINAQFDTLRANQLRLIRTKPDQPQANRLLLDHIAMSRQQAIKIAHRALNARKAESLEQAKTLFDRYNEQDRTLAAWSTPWLQEQWRKIVEAHSRIRNTPLMTQSSTQEQMSFLERLAARARQRSAPDSAQRPAPDQNNNPEPE